MTDRLLLGAARLLHLLARQHVRSGEDRQQERLGHHVSLQDAAPFIEDVIDIDAKRARVPSRPAHETVDILLRGCGIPDEGEVENMSRLTEIRREGDAQLLDHVLDVVVIHHAQRSRHRDHGDEGGILENQGLMVLH